MHAAIGGKEFAAPSPDHFQRPGRGGGVGIEILDVRPQDRRHTAVLADQRREVEFQASGEHLIVECRSACCALVSKNVRMLTDQAD